MSHLQCSPVLQGLDDRHPYVRRTAVMGVLKIYHIDKAMVENTGWGWGRGEGRGVCCCTTHGCKHICRHSHSCSLGYSCRQSRSGHARGEYDNGSEVKCRLGCQHSHGGSPGSSCSVWLMTPLCILTWSQHGPQPVPAAIFITAILHCTAASGYIDLPTHSPFFCMASEVSHGPSA